MLLKELLKDLKKNKKKTENPPWFSLAEILNNAIKRTIRKTE